MSKNEILEELTNIFRDVFENDDLIINEEMSSDDIKGWDSLVHIRIIVAIEKQFLLKLNVNEMSNLKNVGDMIHIIEKKMN